VSEPGFLPQAQFQKGEPGLWDHAPRWRNLTIAASFLTLAAVALPALLPQPQAVMPLPQAAPVRHVAAVSSVRPVSAPAPQPVSQLAAPVRHSPVAPPVRTASLPAQPAPIPEPANPSAANPSAAALPDLPVGTVIVSPGELARINQHNRFSEGRDWPITITIISAPAHGAVTTQDGTALLNFPNAGTRISSVTKVFYQSQPGYKGLDTFTYTRTSADPTDPRNQNVYKINIYVK